ncbi:GDSL-type esterase/lipase family protein [Zeaxanthinibacter sp. PT1]|uniref:GDSL-type esterase/lipase family protein n=1 Tax=Zeaxanthinibacter TaxID=561554 RepID=UPI00234B69EB|nr:GDSL-type esterase/lipase family protein [Zeaxanthinibacter sp. PT1]MDC6352547.1 GDSL-type esterase/lipase family protein [Zeaxanthinibacter sp. PT1]
MNKSLLFSCLLVIQFSYAQQQHPFQEEVNTIVKRYDSIWTPDLPTVVFTGSSSIRLWEELPELFPQYQVINSGFGGSMTADLCHFSQDLISRYQPKKVIIYEGDNDLNDNIKPMVIRRQMKGLIEVIKKEHDSVQVLLIAAKPSPSRWHLKNRFKRLNRKFKRLCKKDKQLTYVNIWDPMILDDKQVRPDIFLEDGLHMTDEGYKIWYNVLKNHLN